MNREDIKDFFDNMASSWDENLHIDTHKINRILDCAHIKPNIDVLDVGCGTGVLFNFYLEKAVNSIKGIDISCKMIEIANRKYSDNRINLECCDAYLFNEGKYDCIVLYNCFPHFDNQELIVKHLSSLLKEGAYLTIAHSMSKKELEEHHNTVKDISLPPIDENELEAIMNKYGRVATKISDNELFILVMKNVHTC